MPNSEQGSLIPAYEGAYVQDTRDGLLLIQGVIDGKLPITTRRPENEDQHLIKSGNVFVFKYRGKSKMQRWTDCLSWSPSRILGEFLIYRENKKPGDRSDKQSYKRTNSEGSNSDLDQTKYSGGVSKQHSIPHRNVQFGLPHQTPHYFGMDHQPSAMPQFGSKQHNDYKLYGSLTNNDDYKEHGLIKKTLSVELNCGFTYRLVSYYLPQDVEQCKLKIPTQDPDLGDIQISPELAETKNLRTDISFSQSPYSEAYHSSMGSGAEYSQSGMDIINQYGGAVGVDIQDQMNNNMMVVSQPGPSNPLGPMNDPNTRVTDDYAYHTSSNFAYGSYHSGYRDNHMPPGHLSRRTEIEHLQTPRLNRYPVNAGWPSQQGILHNHGVVDPLRGPNSANVFLDSNIYYANAPEEEITSSLNSNTSYLPGMVPQSQRHHSYQALGAQSDIQAQAIDGSLKSPDSPYGSKSGAHAPVPTEPNSAISASITTSLEFNSPEAFESIENEFTNDDSSFEREGHPHNRSESVHFLDRSGKNQVQNRKLQNHEPRDASIKDENTDIFPGLDSPDALDDAIGYSSGMPARIITQNVSQYSQNLPIDTSMFNMNNELMSNHVLASSEQTRAMDMSRTSSHRKDNPLLRECYSSNTNPLSSNFNNNTSF